MSSRKLVQIVSRQLSTSARRMADEIHPGYPKLYANMKHFQKPDGVPVHLKGPSGFDTVLYRSTMLLCVIAMGCNVAFCYSMIFPKK